MDEPETPQQPAAEAGTSAAGEATTDAAGEAVSPVLDGILEMLQAGGPVVAILLVLSVAALTIVIVKLWQFREARLRDRKTAQNALRLYRSGRAEEALTLIRGARNPVAQVLGLAIRGLRRGIDEAKVREEVVRYGGEVLETLRSLFRPLEVIAALAPLLGLFGTVLGMIEAFRRLSEAGNRVDPSILSGGIWEALLTTAVGLAVAIPAVAALNWLERRVERVAFELDAVVTQVFTEDLSEESERAGMQSKERRDEPARLRPAAVASGD